VRHGIGVAVALCLLLGACGDDSPTDNAARTTTSNAPGSTIATTTLAPPASFAEALTAAEAQIDAAGTDECKLMGLGNWISAFPSPATRDEVHQAVTTIARYLRALADSAPSELSDVSTQLRRSADDVTQQAEAVGFDPATANSPSGLTALGSQELSKAMARLTQDATTRCK